MMIRKLTVAFCVLVLTSGAFAQDAAAPELTLTPSPEAFAELQALQQEVQTLANRLTEIRNQAFEANPEILSEQRAWQELLMTTMAADGVDIQGAMARVNEMQARLQAGEMDEAEQEATVASLQQESQALQAAHQKAIQSDEVLAAGAMLEKHILEAMTAVDPATESLLAELEKKEAAYQAAVMSAMQSAQAGGQG